jgi:hypothetical protein
VAGNSKWDELFGTRRWRVAAEWSGYVEPDEGGRVTFDHGEFTIDAPGAFRSPLSTNLGRVGVLLQEVAPDGSDVPDSLIPFGQPAVKRAREEFHALV